jgi:radical SAM protein with 4Fe4S-binding SPASM domain
MKSIRNELFIEYLKVRRIIKNQYRNYSGRLRKNQKTAHFPEKLSIELTSLCNASCIWCIHKNSNRLKRDKFMGFKLFKKIIDECKGKNIKTICPSMYGEPLIQKDFLKYLRYIRKILPDTKISLITNGSLLTKERTEELINENLIDVINFSLDGFSKESINQLKKLDYNKILENIRYFLQYKKLKNSKIYSGVSFVLCEENVEEWFKFKKFWKNKADYVHLSFDDGRFTKKYLTKYRNLGPCQSIFDEMYVFSNGKVVLCCMDCLAKYSLGDLNKQTIEEIWKSNQYNAIRKLHKDFKKADYPLCKVCQY